MATINRRTIPFGTYNAGTYQMPAIDLGQTSSRFEIAITRTSLPNTTADVARLTLEGSDDGGATWQVMPGSPGTLAGGTVINKDGSVATESTYGANFDNSKPANFLLRGTVTLFQQLTTGARLTVY